MSEFVRAPLPVDMVMADAAEDLNGLARVLDNMSVV